MDRRVFRLFGNPNVPVPGEEFIGNDQNQQFIFVAEASPPEGRAGRVKVVLSPKIKQNIGLFKSISTQAGNYVGPIGSPEWTHALWEFLYEKDDRVTLEHVERWKRNHPWITAVQGNQSNLSSSEVSSSRIRAATGTLPSETSLGASPSCAGNSQASTSTIPMSSASTENPAQSNPGDGACIGDPRLEKEKLYQYLDTVEELREAFLAQPDLRAALVHLDPIAMLLSRRIGKAVTKKSRAEKVREDLLKEGVPQFVTDFKRDNVIVNDCDSDDEVSACDELLE